MENRKPGNTKGKAMATKEILKGSIINSSGEPSDELVTYLGDLVENLVRGEFPQAEMDGGTYQSFIYTLQEALNHLEAHPSCIERRPYMEGLYWRVKLNKLRVLSTEPYLKEAIKAGGNNEPGPDDGDYC